MADPVACTIATNSYLPYARVLARSFLDHHPEGRVHVLIVDRAAPGIDYEAEPFTAHFVEELDVPGFANLAFRYSVVELSNALKPFFMAHLHAATSCPALCYFDGDVLITAELDDLYRRLESADLVLTPHLLEPLGDAPTPNDRDFLISGAYNLGFLGVSFTPSTRRFLAWWQEKLHQQCRHEIAAGLFLDQRWMDLAPALLPGTVILRDPGYNVAYWNAPHRRLERRGDRFWVGEVPLRFFHFSGFDPRRPEELSRFQDRIALAERPDLKAICQRYAELLAAAGYEPTSGLPYSYATFANGLPIPAVARRALQRTDPHGRRWPDPFAAGDEGSFLAWLLAPAVEGHPIFLPRIALELWEDRDDLRATFPHPAGEDLLAFARWYVDLGAADEQLPEEFVVPTRTALEAHRQLEFTNGVPMPPIARWTLRQIDPRGVRWPDPRTTRDRDSFYAWLRQPVEDAGPICLPRIALLIWRGRSDLQEAFPEPTGEDLLRFATWFVTTAPEEAEIAEEFVAPTRSSLADPAASGASRRPAVAETGLRLPYLDQHPPLAWRFAERVERLLASRDWAALNRPWIGDGGPGGEESLTVFTRALWLSSPYLQGLFPLDTEESRLFFRHWLSLFNPRILDLQSWLLPPIDWHWFARPSARLEIEGEPPVSNLLALLWSIREDMQKVFPPGTAEGRQALLQWAGAGLERDHGQELARIAAMTAPSEDSALGRLGALRSRFRRILGDRPAAPAVPAAVGGLAPGLNLINHPESTMGIAEDARMSALAFAAHGVETSAVALANLERDPAAAEGLRHRTNLIHVNADQMTLAFGKLGPQTFDRRYNVGYWLWELPHCPPPLVPSFSYVDEVWVPSRFVYQTFARVSPVPVVQLPYAVVASPVAECTRAEFGLPDDHFLFLFTFDAAAYIARKNPFAAVVAFQRAFSHRDDRVGLVVKVLNADPAEPNWRRLSELAAEDPRIRILDQALARERVLGLVKLCDCYLSLHRSEGFGRGPAEAMLLGKPVIVTDFGGSTDYCFAHTACLVNYRLVPVAEGEYPFWQDQVWAEPDVDHAVWHMRRLVGDPALRRRIGTAGQHHIRTTYNPTVVGKRYCHRLQCLGLLSRS